MPHMFTGPNLPPPKCFGFLIFHVFWSLNSQPPMFLGLNLPSTCFGIATSHLLWCFNLPSPTSVEVWGFNLQPPSQHVLGSQQLYSIPSTHLLPVLGCQSPISNLFLGLNHPSPTCFWVSITHLQPVFESQSPTSNLFLGLNRPSPICFGVSTFHHQSVL